MRRILLLTGLFVLGLAQSANAIPQFSRLTGVQCNACHSAQRETNDLGAFYRRNGYRMPNLGIHGKPLVALLGSTGTHSGSSALGTTPQLTEKVYAFLTARLDREIVAGYEYYYAKDGSFRIETNQPFVQYTTRGSFAGAPVRLFVGSPALPLPVDTDAYRQTISRYAIFDQTVGTNPFSLSSARNAVSLGFGSQVRGPSATLVAADGRDQHSRLAASGTDRMIEVHESLGGTVIGGYVYNGTRATGRTLDAFVRRALVLDYYRGALAIETLVQTGFDSSAVGTGVGVASSGGYAQLRLQLPQGMTAMARYDGVSQSRAGAFRRSLTIGATRPIARGVSLQLEDVIRTSRQTTHTLNAQLGFGIANTRIGSVAY